jgi:hypothetical protein
MIFFGQWSNNIVRLQINRPYSQRLNQAAQQEAAINLHEVIVVKLSEID